MLIKLNLQRFAPQLGDVTINFDTHIKKVVATSSNWTTSYTWTTSGETLPGDMSLRAVYGQLVTFDVTLDDGYVIDTVTLGETSSGATIKSKTDTQFVIENGSGIFGSPITITSKQTSSSGGTWVLKSSDMIAPDNQINVNINFHNCANDNFTKISIYSEGKGVHISYFNGSDETIVLSGEDGVTGDNATITFATPPTGDLLTWLQANGVKQTAPSTSQVSIDLTTLSGWGNVTSGNHVIQVVAKADGYRDSEKSTAVNFTKGSSFTQVAVTLTNPFSSYISMSASNAPFGRISNMDKTKTYSIQLVFDYYKNDITYLTYNGTKWVTIGYLIIIKNQTETSVDLYKGISGGGTDSLFKVIALEGTTQASVSDFTGYTGTETMPEYICLIEGTLVTLADGTTKPIEDITYDDELLVWNFYDGKFDKAKPCWVTKPQIAHEYNLCKFSNGVEIGFVGQGGDIGYHRVYNDELKSFTHTGVKETPIGTHTFAQDGSNPTLVEQHIVNKQVRFYNIGTKKHINIFTNGILTSSRISNKYAIKDMKYVGERLISEQEEQEYINKKLERC